jgi:hypothetical protein
MYVYSSIKIFKLDCKSIHNRENKIFEINKFLADKYDENMSFKKKAIVYKTKQTEPRLITNRSERSKIEKQEKDEGLFSFMCTGPRKGKEDKSSSKEEESNCLVY